MANDPGGQRARRRAEQAEQAQAFLAGFQLPQRLHEPDQAIAHLGPTNSGKSHDAIEALAAAGEGVYAAPLRLLAREAFDKLSKRCPPGQVGLVTGQEVINPRAPIRCCTTELAPLRGEVLVLDEVHWVDDPDRGWAWGRQLAACEYRQVRLVGALNAEPVLRAAFGKRLEVQRHRRLTPLEWAGPVELGAIEAGSLVVAFSRKAVLALARDVSQASVHRVGALYGTLPPQTRLEQIQAFVAGTLDVLCVTDVVGHGINLPARTVVLAETSKYDGTRYRPLHIWELAQVVGRAGRFGLTEGSGYAQVLRNVTGFVANATLARQAVEAAAGERAAGPMISTASIRPTLEDFAPANGWDLLSSIDTWQLAAGKVLGGHPWLRAASLADVSATLHRLAVDGLLEKLAPAELWRLATLPVDDPRWVSEVAAAVADPFRRLRAVSGPTDAAAWSLEDAERVASRARGLAALARAFPGVGGLDADQLLDVETQASSRIGAVLDQTIADNAFGRCESCRKPCAPTSATCQRCRGAGPRPPARKGYRGPRR